MPLSSVLGMSYLIKQNRIVSFTRCVTLSDGPGYISTVRLLNFDKHDVELMINSDIFDDLDDAEFHSSEKMNEFQILLINMGFKLYITQ